MNLENSLIENELRKYRKPNIDRYDINTIFGYIYVTILPNTQYYIGQKKNLPSMSENYYGSGKILNNWFKKYLNVNSSNCPKELAETNGIIKIILDYAIDRDELNFLESEYIRYAKDMAEFNKQCLNIRSGDYISDFTEASKEGKERFREKMRGRTPWNKGLTKETSDIVNRISSKKIGKKRTKEQKELISRKTKEAMDNLSQEKKEKMRSYSMLGKHHSEKTKKKIIESNKIRGYKEIAYRKCSCITDNKDFDTVLEASYYYNISIGEIYKNYTESRKITRHSQLNFVIYD